MFLLTYTVKPVYESHSREPENVTFYEQLPFKYRLFALFINGENDTALYLVICYIGVPFKPGLIVFLKY